MFDIGFVELLTVAVVALIVVGPERLPSAIRTVGLWVGRIRRTLGSVQREISEELRVDEMRRAAKDQQERLESQVDSLQKPFSESLREDILAPGKPEKSTSSESESSEKTANS
ncbi:Sec-independent protein translocase protein TatB [Motiliproteus sp. MSK22-1]|uniref:Sec-independent protein translocase protein TatB n=1 Tax=Motiliproteus sp. MSK22-1 TaxID=1897630 RepID=UPI0009781280|nr:Sec-independent protein translocase protein TatB [Motiliproteus sp. MSK22-1]OMH39588.1 twin arginine-targeting protein translocase TatB [Motiliproteus sp. MSK22-1]